MKFYLILLVPVLGFFGGCNTRAGKKNEKVTGRIDTTWLKYIDTLATLGANYELSALTPELSSHLTGQLKNAEGLIIKYNGKLPASKFDAAVLDRVFEKWMNDQSPSKESLEYFIEAIGAAFGQDLADNLDCEWKILEDKYGKDLTAIHKKYKLNSFPFSSAEKAYTENRTGSFEKIKIVLKEKIREAEQGGEISER